MSQAEIANIINNLVEMLTDNGVSEEEIRDALDLGPYAAGYCGLGWLFPDD